VEAVVDRLSNISTMSPEIPLIGMDLKHPNAALLTGKKEKKFTEKPYDSRLPTAKMYGEFGMQN